jgi:predicted nucleotidyltransferase
MPLEFAVQQSGPGTLALLLYGSRARRDAAPESDVDMLAVTADPESAALARRQLGVPAYTFGAVIRHARNGDLFTLHLVNEARVIYEVWPLFAEIQRAFTYRQDYTREIALASDVGWLLVHNAALFGEPKRMNQWIAWCTRTILIAQAANQRQAIFSAEGLATFYGSPDVTTLVRNKTSPTRDAGILAMFQTLLEGAGTVAPPPSYSLAERQRRFEADRNVAGLSALRALS